MTSATGFLVFVPVELEGHEMGIRPFANVSEQFLPPMAHRPDLTFGVPWLHYVWRTPVFNATDELLDRAVRRGYGERIAFIDVPHEECWTYYRLQGAVNRCANALRALGVQPGDRVVMRLDDVPEAAVVQLAVWKIGALVVPTATAESARELAFIFSDVEPTLLVCDREYLADVELARPSASNLRAVVAWPDAPSGDYESFHRLLATQSEAAETYPNRPLDASGIYYTGGTTGQPKGCLHTHAAEVVLADLNNLTRGITASDVFLTHAPIGHAFGNGEKINFPLRAGASAIYSVRPSAEGMWQLASQYGATVMAGAATIYRMMLQVCPTPREAYPQLCLRQAISSGEILDQATYERWYQATGFNVRNTVGMTPMRHLFIDSYLFGQKVAPQLSVGRPLPGYEARLVDPLTGETIFEPEQPGRLAVRGPTGITYWVHRHTGIQQRAEQDLRDGWSLLDDAYLWDQDGWLWFQTRLDDMIVTGGRQVAPSEVEDVLTQHPAVAEAAVIGLPDSLRGQTVTAVVVLRPDTISSPALIAELQEFSKNQMARYKYPRRIEFVTELPKDRVGKLQRRILRAWLTSSSALEQT
ncbi:MAG: acyl-CoA synthetase [Ktedonobacteraceae bacterium]|nr:acyl-CoA synthetase [Ktedonobacteraceae bacterium]